MKSIEKPMKTTTPIDSAMPRPHPAKLMVANSVVITKDIAKVAKKLSM